MKIFKCFTRTKDPLLGNDLFMFSVGVFDEVIGGAQNCRTKTKEMY